MFPELGRSRESDALEARFNAFKIPESNFLVFEATVRTCRGGCQPVSIEHDDDVDFLIQIICFQAYCPGPSGRSEPSFGRRKRSVEENATEFDGTAEPLIGSDIDDEDEVSVVNGTVINETKPNKNATKDKDDAEVGDLEANASEMPEQVREMIEVN